MKKLRTKLYKIVFNAETPLEKGFDILIISLIFLSIITVILDSIPSLHIKFFRIFKTIEWVITFVFTVEYFMRIYLVRHPIKYIFSFYGIIDLLAVLPSYLELFINGEVYGLAVIRAFRLLRFFRVVKLNRYTNEGKLLIEALKASKYKISVFFCTVAILVITIGSFMYLIEGAGNGFTSIPVSIYWAIVTLTTVGYGDISPDTALGQFFASLVMILGYAIIAVPTGIVTSEVTKRTLFSKYSAIICPECLYDMHEIDAKHCKNCGTELEVKS